MLLKVSPIVILILILSSCARQNEVKDKRKGSSNVFAQRFSIRCFDTYTQVAVFGNRGNLDTTSIFILYRTEVPDAKGIPVRVPCKKIASLSCIYSSMFCELGCAGQITGIDNIDYVNDSAILARWNKNQIVELARTPEIDLEKTMQLKPDVLFTFGMGNPAEDANPRLEQAGIPVVVTLDHLEAHPLGRAEWIRFFAAFTGKLNVADSIFENVQSRYLDICATTKSLTSRPTVFSEMRYGDVWYMPGGKSFMSTLINDAGGKYLWDDNDKTGSLPLSFEQVYDRAAKADYWINLPMVFSIDAIKAADERYQAFDAFQKGNVYNNTKHHNAKNYSTYWESGMAHPERILSDLLNIFHPGLNKQNPDFYYYEKLQ